MGPVSIGVEVQPEKMYKFKITIKMLASIIDK